MKHRGLKSAAISAMEVKPLLPVKMEELPEHGQATLNEAVASLCMMKPAISAVEGILEPEL